MAKYNNRPIRGNPNNIPNIGGFIKNTANGAADELKYLGGKIKDTVSGFKAPARMKAARGARSMNSGASTPMNRALNNKIK